jgi:STE24 endopeptidase
MGQWRTRRVLLSDTLLAEFTPEETSAVLAHELGHDRKGHLKKWILLQTGAGLLAFYASDRVLGWAAAPLGLSGKGDVAGLPLLLLVFLVGGILGAPLVRALSRRLEAGCDAFALRLTGEPEAFISAMRKLSRLNLAEEAPSRLVEWLFYSHPPILKRIEMAERCLLQKPLSPPQGSTSPAKEAIAPGGPKGASPFSPLPFSFRRPPV